MMDRDYMLKRFVFFNLIPLKPFKSEKVLILPTFLCGLSAFFFKKQASH